VEAEKHGLVLKEVSHLSRQYPALLSGELVNKLAALAVHATTRTAVADLRNEYNLARVDRSLEKLTVDRGWRQNNSKENSTTAAVTIVSVSGEAVRRGQDVQGRDIQRGTEVAVIQQPPYPHAVNSSSSNSSSSTTTATTATASSAPYTVPTGGGSHGLSSHVIRQGGQYHFILIYLTY